MTRPRYETAEDRVREAGAADIFAASYENMEVRKLSQGARADFLAIKNGKPVAYIEVKTRTCTSRTYSTYHVSKDKLVSLSALAKKDGLRAVLLVQWKDRTGMIGVDEFLALATFKTGGRWDRGDRFDVEEMAEVDINRFKFLKGA